MLPHLPFFMDLAPSDFNLLTNMKKTLESCVFADNEEIIAIVMSMHDMLETFLLQRAPEGLGEEL